MRRSPLILLLIAVALVAAAVIHRSGSTPTVRASFDSAVNLVTGNEVTLAGTRVGRVGSIEVSEHGAEVELRIDDDRVWPLREGTTARIRFGGTVSYSDRYVELSPGPGSAAEIEDGGRLPPADSLAAVEFDELFNTFTEEGREELGSLIDRGSRTLGPRARRLREALGAAGPGLAEAAETLGRLGADPLALRTLAASGATAAGGLAARRAELVDLVDGAGATFDEIAEHATATMATIERMPATLRAARGTLARVDGSLERLDPLIGELAPGAARSPALARALAGAVERLTVVAPRLRRTLATVDAESPRITRFLKRTAPFAGRLGPALADLEPISSCLRPYAPEVAGYFGTWRALANVYDGVGTYARSMFQQFGFPGGAATTSEQVTSLVPNLGYAFFRPPGFGAFQEIFPSGCGITPAALDAANDPEARP